jgi:hypothetical protein
MKKYLLIITVYLGLREFNNLFLNYHTKNYKYN